MQEQEVDARGEVELGQEVPLESAERLKSRVIAPDELFISEKVTLRLLTPEDCGERYLSWLNDPEVNRFLEVRWQTHTIESLKSFVAALASHNTDYFFAILDTKSMLHIGNIKIGLVNPVHAYGDLAYLIGDKSFWRQGYATAAIKLATDIAFARLGLHRVQAGLYASNVASWRALARNGFVLEARLREKCRLGQSWDDHIILSVLRAEWDERQLAENGSTDKKSCSP